MGYPTDGASQEHSPSSEGIKNLLLLFYPAAPRPRATRGRKRKCVRRVLSSGAAAEAETRFFVHWRFTSPGCSPGVVMRVKDCCAGLGRGQGHGVQHQLFRGHGTLSGPHRAPFRTGAPGCPCLSSLSLDPLASAARPSGPERKQVGRCSQGATGRSSAHPLYASL